MIPGQAEEVGAASSAHPRQDNVNLNVLTTDDLDNLETWDWEEAVASGALNLDFGTATDVRNLALEATGEGFGQDDFGLTGFDAAGPDAEHQAINEDKVETFEGDFGQVLWLV